MNESGWEVLFLRDKTYIGGFYNFYVAKILVCETGENERYFSLTADHIRDSIVHGRTDVMMFCCIFVFDWS